MAGAVAFSQPCHRNATGLYARALRARKKKKQQPLDLLIPKLTSTDARALVIATVVFLVRSGGVRFAGDGFSVLYQCFSSNAVSNTTANINYTFICIV